MEPRIEFEADLFSQHGLTLLVDGVAQSHVDPADPTRLFFEYTRRIGHVVDALGAPGSPLRVLHLGGGALTLPRYVEATRPGSSQLVVEFDARLHATVVERLPLPAGADLRVLIEDARHAVPALAAVGAPPFDLVVVDLYTRLEPPSFVATAEFMSGCLELLSDHGVLVVNVADAEGLVRLREQARAIADAAPAVALLVAGDPGVLSGAEEGNSVLVAGAGGLPGLLREALLTGGPHPAEVLDGERLDAVLQGPLGR